MARVIVSDALVGNAGDEAQVKAATAKAKRRRIRELDDLRAVLAIVEGRRLLWRLMQHCKVFESVFHDNSALMGHLTGRQDVGHFVMDEINKAQPDAFLGMMQDHHTETT